MCVSVGLTSGGAFQSIPCNPGARVMDVLNTAGITLVAGDQVLHNGRSVAPEYPVKDEALILVSKPIEGG